MPTKQRPSAATDVLTQSGESLSTETDVGADSLTAAADALTRASQQSAQSLSAGVQALAQATQQLVAVASQLGRAAESRAGDIGAMGASAPAGTQISAWEDDPFSEAVATPNPTRAQPVSVAVPVVRAPLLKVSITDQRPAPGKYAPGSANFRYWTAAEALARGIAYWAALLPSGTRWSAMNPVLQASLDAGETLNAFYSRTAGLRFFHATVGNNVTVFSGESPDVVCHELGHAVLDAVRPELFNAASLEVAAFHENFGDISSILTALQLPTVRQKVLQETQGRLNATSRLSRLAEQLGWAIRQQFPDAVDADCLRNAANRFFYQQPEGLPPSAPATRLSSEPHSFARVFTGAFLDALARMVTVAGTPSDATLVAVSRDMGLLIVDGVRTAAVVPAYYSQVAAAMIQADGARNNGRYRTALAEGFLRHGILSPEAITGLADAPLPRVEAAAAAYGTETVGGFGSSGFADDAIGAQTLLTYDGGNAEDGHLRGYGETPELPERPIAVRFTLPGKLLVHAPAQEARIVATPAALDMGSVETPEPDYAAQCFVEDLIRRGKLDLGSMAAAVPELSSPEAEKTHVLANTPSGLVLKRLHFDCGHCRHG
jgi:hypothetical protein